MEIGNKREKKKQIKVPKAENLSTFEDYISATILTLLPYCPYNAIHEGSLYEGSKISKNTIKVHLRQGKVPPAFFDSYIRAFGKLKRLDIKTDEGHDFPDLDKMKNLIETHYDFFKSLNKAYKSLKEYPYGVIFEKIESWDSTKGPSQRFWYLLNKCFEAFWTLNYEDVLFLIKFFKSEEAERQTILTKMDQLKANNYFCIIDSLMNGEGKVWIDAHNKYSSNTLKKSSADQNLEILNKKIKELTVIQNCDDEIAIKVHKARIISRFFALVWPKKGETDTQFGPKEIEALLVFKYFLTEEAQQKLIDELYENLPEE